MTASRHLEWDGTSNVRDLGGLPCRDGRVTAWNAVVRGDEPDGLTDAGRAALWDHGVRTVIDLREPVAADGRLTGLPAVNVPLDDHSRTDFWLPWSGGLDCTPLYYRAFLDTFPGTVADVVGHVAQARPGAVLIHCSAGRDRTGLITLLLLDLAGVEHDAIVEDYLDSARRLEPLWRRRGLGDQNGKIDALVRDRGTTIEQSLRELLTGLDSEAVLRDGGLSARSIDAVRSRLVSSVRASDRRET